MILYRPLLLLALLGGLAQPAHSTPAVLLIDQPWQTSGTNTGVVAASAVSGTSLNDLWYTSVLTRDYGDTNIYGSLAMPGTLVGHMFAVVYAAAVVDTVTITLNGPIQDPIFYILDIDAPDVTVTVSPGGTAFVCDVDCFWNGDTATTTVAQDTSGSPVVQYAGLYGAGHQFTFLFDYSAVPSIGGDIVGIGLGTMVPEPSAAWLLLAIGVAFASIRPHRG